MTAVGGGSGGKDDERTVARGPFGAHRRFIGSGDVTTPTGIPGGTTSPAPRAPAPAAAPGQAAHPSPRSSLSAMPGTQGVGGAGGGGGGAGGGGGDYGGGHTLPPGTRVGDLEITGLIGEGGFGIVYLAYDASLERRVAVKEYMPSSLATRSPIDGRVRVRSERHAETFRAGLKSFVNEARLLARFDHPSLVKVYRFWEDHGTAYMVMPYYDGPTLKRALAERDAPPDEAQLRAWLAPLLDALETIHSAHCYHRDIAPDNIILTAQGPLLLDFGAARRVIGDMTHALTVVLKPGYAPIEQYGDVATMIQGAWTDLYALACVVYHAITGKTPMSSVERLLADRMEPMATLAAGRYGERFLRAIDVALSVKPADRPQDVQAFRELLDMEGARPAASIGAAADSSFGRHDPVPGAYTRDETRSDTRAPIPTALATTRGGQPPEPTAWQQRTAWAPVGMPAAPVAPVAPVAPAQYGAPAPRTRPGTKEPTPDVGERAAVVGEPAPAPAARIPAPELPSQWPTLTPSQLPTQLPTQAPPRTRTTAPPAAAAGGDVGAPSAEHRRVPPWAFAAAAALVAAAAFAWWLARPAAEDGTLPAATIATEPVAPPVSPNPGAAIATPPAPPPNLPPATGIAPAAPTRAEADDLASPPHPPAAPATTTTGTPPIDERPAPSPPPAAIQPAAETPPPAAPPAAPTPAPATDSTPAPAAAEAPKTAPRVAPNGAANGAPNGAPDAAPAPSPNHPPAPAAATPPRRAAPTRAAADPTPRARDDDAPRAAAPRRVDTDAELRTRCSDTLLKASLEPLTPHEASFLRRECR